MSRNLSFERGANRLFWRIFSGSLVAHVAFLGMPWPDESLPPEVSQSEHKSENELGAIALTDLAIAPLPPKKSAPQQNLQSGLQSSLQPTEPQPAPIPNPIRPVQSALQPVPQPASTNSTAHTQISNTSDQLPLSADFPASSLADDSAGDLEPEGGSEYDTVVRLGDRFPHLAQAQAGCFGLENCHRLSGDGSYRSAAKQLKTQMKAAGYQVHERDDLADSGHQVFEVIPPDQPETVYYLNVFSDGLGSTVYVLTFKVLSLDQLQKLNG